MPIPRATFSLTGKNQWLKDDTLRAVQSLKPIAEEAGITLSQLALAWVLNRPNVTAVIVGATRPEQVYENVKASGLKLEAELFERMDEILDPIIERDPSKTQQLEKRP